MEAKNLSFNKVSRGAMLPKTSTARKVSASAAPEPFSCKAQKWRRGRWRSWTSGQKESSPAAWSLTNEEVRISHIFGPTLKFQISNHPKTSKKTKNIYKKTLAQLPGINKNKWKSPRALPGAPFGDRFGGIRQVGRTIGARHDAGDRREIEAHHIHKAIPVKLKPLPSLGKPKKPKHSNVTNILCFFRFGQPCFRTFGFIMPFEPMKSLWMKTDIVLVG